MSSFSTDIPSLITKINNILSLIVLYAWFLAFCFVL